MQNNWEIKMNVPETQLIQNILLINDKMHSFEFQNSYQHYQHLTEECELLLIFLQSAKAKVGEDPEFSKSNLPLLLLYFLSRITNK